MLLHHYMLGVDTVAFNVLLLSLCVTFESLDKYSLHVAMHVIRWPGYSLLHTVIE